MKKVTRRDFVASAAAMSALYAIEGVGRASAAGGPYDVVVVGAGAAGISAGLRLKAAGKKYVILEARNRVGGRTFTDTTSFPGIRWDLGAQWFHFVTPQLAHPSLTNNPLFDIARKQHKRTFPDLNERLLLAPPKPRVNIVNSPAIPLVAEIAIDIIGAGLGASLGAARDISAAAATANSAHKPYYKFVSGLIQAALGGSLDDLSCYDVYNESQGGALLPPIVPSFDNWLIPSGLGAVVTGLAKGLDIHTGTVVNRIRWGGRGVTVETSAGRVQAKAAIVTVPVGPLAAGKPDFQPDLPKPYQTALERQIEMGHTAKIGLMFADGFRLDVPHFNTFVSPNADSTQIPLVQTRAWGHDNFAILIASGTKIAELEKSGDLVHYAREQMRDLFGTKTFNAFRKGVATSWNTSPYSMGAFSHARPGGVPGRKRLAKPIDGKLFFAGEAVSIDQHSSAPGAYTTGKVAAERAISALKTG